MKICLFGHSFPPTIGGGQTHMYYLAYGLSLLGHDVCVVTGEVSEDTHFENRGLPKKNFKLIRLKGFYEYAKDGKNFTEFLARACKVVSKFNPDIIHAHGFLPCVAADIISKTIGSKLVFTYYSTPVPEEGKIGGLFGDESLEFGFTRWVLETCNYDYLISISRYYKDWAVKLGSPSKKNIVIYPSVDTSLFHPASSTETRTKLGFVEGDILICVPARFIKRKGAFDIVKSLMYLPDNFKLVIATSKFSKKDPFVKSVLNFINKHNLSSQIRIEADKFAFYDMPKIFNASDLVVLPSHVEGLGIVLMEAAACQKPIIACKVDGVSEVISDGVNGLLVDSKSPRQLANAVLKLSKNSKLARKLAIKGSEQVKRKFNQEEQIKKIENVYHRVLS